MTKVRALRLGPELDFTQQDGELRCVLPMLDLCETIVVEFKTPEHLERLGLEIAHETHEIFEKIKRCHE